MGKFPKYNSYLLVGIQDDGPRTANGNPPIIYAPKHVHLTDNTRFSRDNLPKNPLEDDSPWYLEKPDRSYVNLCDAGKIKLVKNILIVFSFCFLLIAYRGDLQTLLDAFKRGVPVDITDKFRKTPLMVGKFLKVHKSFFVLIKNCPYSSMCSW